MIILNKDRNKYIAVNHLSNTNLYQITKFLYPCTWNDTCKAIKIIQWLNSVRFWILTYNIFGTIDSTKKPKIIEKWLNLIKYERFWQLQTSNWWKRVELSSNVSDKRFEAFWTLYLTVKSCDGLRWIAMNGFLLVKILSPKKLGSRNFWLPRKRSETFCKLSCESPVQIC